MIPAIRKILFLVLFTLLNFQVYSQERKPEDLGWFFEARLSGLWTGGNSKSVTIGLGTTVKRTFAKSEIRFDAGGTQTESSLTTRTAVGSTDQFKINEQTCLDGSGSYDPESEDNVTYAWSQVDGPRVTLYGADTAFPCFTPTILGKYIFSLTVSDEKARSLQDLVEVKVSKGGRQ